MTDEQQRNYNIPSNNRELQPVDAAGMVAHNYNIPSNNRELQHRTLSSWRTHYYNIPSNNRELQLVGFDMYGLAIITYQVITGNYSR